MKIIGLTGPSGSGKGFCCEIFNSKGIPSIDTDAVYHELISRPTDCTSELVEKFGDVILCNNGSVNRQVLGGIVFSDKSCELLECLNCITHKYVIKKTFEMVERYRGEGVSAVIIDAPLLIEAKINEKCDFVISVLADVQTRLQRILERDGISEESALARIKSQKPDRFYIENSNYVVHNDGSSVLSQIEKILISEGIA